ncbi:hypothetical protein CVT24_012749 [Panaeolus cyanescens]|uniref:GST N-terminal domain-containing protein n=1 Tax=Panaeolus cyanescens TaxID=181874 RepID=A0A409YJP8_9AGAR|nr:hypothetical protein CVT24_012749 [Panaeolus cyanescens]
MSDSKEDAVSGEFKFNVQDLPNDKITFFDMQFTTPDRRLSPFTTLIRYALKIKEIPFHTHFIPMHAVRAVSESLSISPVWTSDDGTPLYTLPAIYDPTNLKEDGTPTALSDSLPICQYLDERYPIIVGHGSIVLSTKLVGSDNESASTTNNPPSPAQINAFTQRFTPEIDYALLPFILPKTLPWVPLASVPYFRRTREKWFGKKIEDMVPANEEERARAWATVREGFEDLERNAYGGWGVESSEGTTEGQVEGLKEAKYTFKSRLDELRSNAQSPNYIDTFVAGRLYWMRKVFGDDSEEWRDVRRWSGGMWGDWLDLFEERYGEADV